MTDQQLIEGLSALDRPAINYLVNTYQNKVIKTAYYFIGNMEDAEDLSQDIFLEIIRSIGSFKGNSTLSTWIYRISVNRSMNVIRKNKRRALFSGIERFFGGNGGKVVLVVEGVERVKEAGHCHDPFEEKEIKEFVNKIISKLPENQRIAYVLSKYEDLSYKEIADIMSLSLSSVESLIHRAKINLQKMFVAHYHHY